MPLNLQSNHMVYQWKPLSKNKLNYNTYDKEFSALFHTPKTESFFFKKEVVPTNHKLLELLN